MNIRSKTGGRQKGTPNKCTNEIRERISEIVNDELSQLKSELQKLDAKDRIETLIKLMPYIVPKLKEITTDSTINIETEVKERPRIVFTERENGIEKPLYGEDF